MTTKQYSFERYLNVRAASGASFSPDSRHMSFLTDITGVPEVWSIPIDHSSSSHTHTVWPNQLTFRGERIARADFSPSEPVLLVAGEVGGNERTQLYLLSQDGATFSALTACPDVIHAFGGW